MKKILPRQRTLRILTLIGALILFLGIGYAGARHIAWPWYKAWREDRANNIARDYFAKGDYPNALVAVRKTLGYNPYNTEAWKLAVEITEKQNSPQVIYYQQRLATVQPTLENKLKHLRLAVKYHAYTNALETIEKSGADVTKSPEFYELAATVAQHKNDLIKAKYYLISLLALQPGNNKARLDLAQVRLLEGYEENKPALRSEIEALASTDPALRTRALGILLADAVDSKNTAAALPLTDQLATAPDLTPQMQLLIADAYRLAAPDRAAPYIAQLEKNAATLEKILPTANYLVRHDQSAEARRWIETLPDDLRSDETLQVTYAFALHTLDDTAALEIYLRDLKWTDNEFIRYALLSHAYRQHADLRASNDAWRLALIQAGNTPAKLQFLLSQTTLWGWPDQKYEVLWKKFAIDPADKTTRAQLATWEYSKGNTANLNRLFARISEYDPSDRDARNNYNYTSLILNLNTDHATRDAEALYTATPDNAYYATTYALSLYRQNKSQDALRIINTLGAAALMIPERALIRAVILIASGRIDEGLDQVAQVKLDRLLPDERRLYTETAPLVAKARRDQASAARLAGFNSAAPTSAAERKSWLAPLPAAYRENATVQMELADNLYATDDYNGLAETLRSDRWERNDFLRHALLAYAQRNLQRDIAARDTWRIALGTAGLDPSALAVLEDLCERWGWIPERVEIQNRIIQRNPGERKNFAELADYYTKNGQTSELARIYALRVDSEVSDIDSKIRFAYYSLLTDTNTARAHVIAKEVYDETPANPAAAKVYAFSLLKQSRAADGWRVIAVVPDRPETGIAQTSLLKAALAARQNDPLQASAQLNSFDSKTALPEEIALADALRRTIAMAKNS